MTKIAVKVYEEIKTPGDITWDYDIEWLDKNGINTPYKVTIIGGEKDGTGR